MLGLKGTGAIPSASRINGEVGANYIPRVHKEVRKVGKRWGRASKARVSGALGKFTARMRTTAPAH